MYLSSMCQSNGSLQIRQRESAYINTLANTWLSWFLKIFWLFQTKESEIEIQFALFKQWEQIKTTS